MYVCVCVCVCVLVPNPTNTADLTMMATRAYSTKDTWYVEYEVTGPPGQRKKYEGEVIQMPAVRGLLNQRTINLMWLI